MAKRPAQGKNEFKKRVRVSMPGELRRTTVHNKPAHGGIRPGAKS